MILVLTILVRDEIDIIKSMIDFHLAQGVDHIIATDNGSTDGTYEVCREYEKKGKIELLCEPPSDFSQHRWVTRMANLAQSKYSADWVINADADELFVPSDKQCSLKDILNKIPESKSVLHLARHDFVSNVRPMKESVHLEMIYRKVISHNIKGTPLKPKAIHRGSPNVRVSQGNHRVTGDKLGEPYLTEKISVYHYPIRSYPQFYSKVYNGGSGYAKNIELNPGIGFHKRFWYELLLKDELRHLYDSEYRMGAAKLNEAIKNKEIVEERSVMDFIRANIR